MSSLKEILLALSLLVAGKLAHEKGHNQVRLMALSSSRAFANDSFYKQTNWNKSKASRTRLSRLILPKKE